MKHFWTLLLLGFAGLINAQTPLWMRYPAISPDGSQIAFAYKGDLYVVSSSPLARARETAEIMRAELQVSGPLVCCDDLMGLSPNSPQHPAPS